MVKDKTVVIVDDHKLFRTGFSLMVDQAKGYQLLFAAENGVDFIRQLNPAALPSIVAVAPEMPEMDGYETVIWIKKYYPSVKVLALGFADRKDELEKMRIHGADKFLSKTASQDEMIEIFRKVLRK